MVIAIPSLFKLVKGWHARPGKETVTIGLRQQADRSPSGTGRAHVAPTAPVDRHLHCSMPPISQTGTVEPLTVATHQNRWWTPQATTPILTGISLLGEAIHKAAIADTRGSRCRS